jgi:hypothetical protein
MSRVLLVHGIGQQYKGVESLRADCAPALRDGVGLAGGKLDADEVEVAFYGDIFRPQGSRSSFIPDYDASDVSDPFELGLLEVWRAEVERMNSSDGYSSASAMRVRTPNWVQRALLSLSSYTFFSGLSERVIIGSLKQVGAYFSDSDVRRRIQRRVADSLTGETQVVVGHSLGSVIAYEALCAAPSTSATTLVTLGAPLGIPNLIFDRLLPVPLAGRGIWPAGVRSWTNVADRADVVALRKELAPLFGSQLIDVSIHNGVKAHDVRPYLTAEQTGRAIVRGLG